MEDDRDQECPSDRLKDALDAANQVLFCNVCCSFLDVGPTADGDVPQAAELAPESAQDAYFAIVLAPDLFDDAAIKTKEEALYQLTGLYVKERQLQSIMGLLQQANPFFAQIAKVRHSALAQHSRLTDAGRRPRRRKS
jgi:hypothetical protein